MHSRLCRFDSSCPATDQSQCPILILCRLRPIENGYWFGTSGVAGVCSNLPWWCNWLSTELSDDGGEARVGLITQADRKSTRPELQSQSNLVCRLLLEKKKNKLQYARRYATAHMRDTHR